MPVHHTPCRTLLLGAAALSVLSSGAQPLPTTLSYTPVLQDHQRYAPEQVTSWPQANQTVHERGGWRAYAREAAPPGAAPSAPATPGAAHTGHGHHTPPTPAAGGAR